MSSSRKARGDSRIKTLPEELQAEIYNRLKTGGTYLQVKKWLASEMEVVTSVASLSEFYSWYALRSDLAKTDEDITQLMELMQDGSYSLETKQVEALGNALFLVSAQKSGDWKAYKGALELILKHRKMSVEERKVAILEQKAKAFDQIQQATKGKPSSELTPEERQMVLDVMDESLGIKKP